MHTLGVSCVATFTTRHGVAGLRIAECAMVCWQSSKGMPWQLISLRGAFLMSGKRQSKGRLRLLSCDHLLALCRWG